MALKCKIVIHLAAPDSVKTNQAIAGICYVLMVTLIAVFHSITRRGDGDQLSGWGGSQEGERETYCGGGQVSGQQSFPSQIQLMADYIRALWVRKKQEERDVLFKDIEELRELGRMKMFGRWNYFVQNLVSTVAVILHPVSYFLQSAKIISWKQLK